MNHLPQDIGVPYIGITSSEPGYPPFFEDGAFGHAPFSGPDFTEHRWQEPMFDDGDYGEEYYENDLAEYSNDPYSDNGAVFNRSMAHARHMGFRTGGVDGHRTSGHRGQSMAERGGLGWGAAAPLYAGRGGMATRGSGEGGSMAAHGRWRGHAGRTPATAAGPPRANRRTERPGRSGPTGHAGVAGAARVGGVAVAEEAGRIPAGEGASRRGMHGLNAARTGGAERSSRPGRAQGADRAQGAGPVTDSEDQ